MREIAAVVMFLRNDINKREDQIWPSRLRFDVLIID